MLGPIFNREWLTVPRRSRHYVTRVVYLGVLWILGLTAWQATVGWGRTATLGDTARFGVLLFQVLLLYVQLPLTLFFAALSGVSAITQEKDRRTFVLLLVTDLRNYEIVLGKMAGSLLPIAILLASTIPLLTLIVLLGGVAPWQVFQAVLVLAALALAAGSLGGLVALWRDKTFQALALTVLFLVLYLCLVEGLAVVPALASRVPWAESLLANFDVAGWQEWLGPRQALQSVLEPAEQAQAGLAPAFGFGIMMVLFSILLNIWGIVRLRAWNPSGEPIMQREVPDEEEEKDRLKAHAAPGPVRPVWANPILWREIATRAYGRRPLLVKAAYLIVVALVCYFALSPLWTRTEREPFAAAFGLVPIGILSLLLIAAQAVTAITSERDIGALDLLLVTDLTPQEFIFGKLGGICYNTLIYVLPPLVLAGVYAWLGWLATPPRNHPELLAARNIEALVCVVLAALVLEAFAMVLGVHVALRNQNSRLAVINTLGTVFFLSVGTLLCIELIVIHGQFEYQWLSFIFFLAAGIGGLWWVLSGDRPSAALTLASWVCPLAMYYTVTTIVIGKPGSPESADPVLPFLVITGAFGFTLAAMLVPLLSEFDVALGRTTGPGE
ncbi:MAG TPA: ABC transporter permease [Gemmataceae bacterium]|nr:ABC transporter permease [Gemmataceae bacterium]